MATRHAVDTIQVAREACGGQGFLSVNRLTSMRTDADVFTTYEGDNAVLTQLVAKALLSEFGQQFESMNTTGMARYLFRRTAAAVTEASPVTVSTTDPNRLSSASWQIEQLRWRQNHLVEALANRVKKRIGDGATPLDAFTAVQTHAAAAAASFADRAVLESFAAAVARIDDGPVRDALDRLRALHGLATIRAELSWYQEHGHLSSATARAVRRVHDRLVTRVAGESLELVDAFDIPDSVLAAPIAAGNPPKGQQA